MVGDAAAQEFSMIEARLLRVAFLVGPFAHIDGSCEAGQHGACEVLRVPTHIEEMGVFAVKCISEQASAANASVVVFFSEEGGMGCVGSLWLL